MIQANELRLGNWINFTGGTTSTYYQRVSVEILQFLLNDNFKPHKIQPIQLTPELLEKAGFYKDEFNEAVFILGDFQIRYVYSNKKFYLCYKVGDKYSLSSSVIQYIHQLQNLYFAITGEEITL